MKKTFKILLTTIFVLGLIPVNFSDAEGIPKIFSINPTQIQVGDEIEITGVNFTGYHEVGINCTAQQILSWSDTIVKARVTESRLGTNYVCFDCNTTCFRDVPFEVCKTPNCVEIAPPKITSVSLTTLRIGNTIDIFGENFNNANSGETELWSRKSIGGAGFGEIIYSSDAKITIKLGSGSNHGQGRVCLQYKTTRGAQDETCSPYFTVEEVCDWGCSDWSDCSESNTQTRTCTKPSDCQSLNTPMPQTTSVCTYAPPCTSSNYNCTDWSFCLNGKQTRQCARSPHCIGGVPEPATSQSCTLFPICTTNNWSCGNWSVCSTNGVQNRSCNKVSYCEGGVTSPATTQSCTYVLPAPACTADTWTCGAWDSCSLSGIQNRSCTKTFDCPNVQTAPPTTDQYCEPPNRPIPQTPPSGTDEILNQDSIIKSSVKLVCPVDAQRASQGSGTVIDPSGVILTNKHVIAGTLGCIVGFINDFNDEPYFGERQIADIFKLSSNQDVAILKIRNPKNTRLSYVDITKGSVNFPLGTKITTYGYPAKFGTNITYTSGDFSGTDGSYLKTTAILEYGNSGGGAYLKNGVFVGIPSAVVKGQLNAMGYLLSINTINSWLGNSSAIYSDSSNNNYSRVSVLEDIDLKKLNSLKLFIPDTDAKGDLSDSAKNKAMQNSQNAKEKSEPSQTQKESTIIESTDTNQKTNSEQRKNMVANAVQEMVKVAERNGKVGQEIKTIAQTQTQNQEKLETGIQKIQSRGGFVRFFIGPNYSEIKNSQKLLEQNKEQIQKLNDIRTQIVNKEDQLQVVEQIQALEQVEQQIETSLNESQKGFNLFGWAFRLFSR